MLNRLNQKIKSILLKTNLSHSIIYLISNKVYRGEKASVLAGIRKFLKGNSTEYLITRNIHRIEKGLSMKDRKEIFAKDYIEETVIALENILPKASIKEEWYRDVLFHYFNTVTKDSNINQLGDKFRKKDILSGQNRFPYPASKRTKSSVNYNNFFLLTQQRRSVRFYKDMTVEKEIIEKAVLAAAQSPSACNRQPFKFIIVDKSSPRLLKKIRVIPGGVNGYEENINTFGILVGDLSAYFDERDRHLIYIDSSLAMMSFILALETQNVSSCLINWPAIPSKEIEIRKHLDLKKHEQIIMCFALGYADEKGMIPYSAKKGINDLLKYL